MTTQNPEHDRTMTRAPKIRNEAFYNTHNKITTEEHKHPLFTTTTTIMARLVFLLLIALLSASPRLVDSERPVSFVITTMPCANVSVYPGTTEDDCLAACATTADLNWTDYSEGPTKEDPQVYRNVHCNCSQPFQPDYFRCVDRTVVWNVQEKPVDTCDTFDITSRVECKDFCLDLDAGDYKVDIVAGEVSLCQCGTVTVCESAGAKSSFGGAASALVATLLASIGIIAMTL